jgi:hypothetical protein
VSALGCRCPKLMMMHELDGDNQMVCPCDPKPELTGSVLFTDEFIVTYDLEFAGVGFSMKHADDCAFDISAHALLN